MFSDEEVMCIFTNKNRNRFKEHMFDSKDKSIDLQPRKLHLKRNKILQIGIASQRI